MINRTSFVVPGALARSARSSARYRTASVALPPLHPRLELGTTEVGPGLVLGTTEGLGLLGFRF